MAISVKEILDVFGALFLLNQKNSLYESHWMFFGPQVAKLCEKSLW
jgi:hypothetical protein